MVGQRFFYFGLFFSWWGRAWEGGGRREAVFPIVKSTGSFVDLRAGRDV